VLAAVMLSGCANTPRETVELSTTVGRDLAETHRAHRELAMRYFGTLKANINTFIDNVYRPYAIENGMEQFNLLGRLTDEELTPNRKLITLDVFVKKTIEEVEGFRAELLYPIDSIETEVIRSIDNAYARMLNANAIVTGHLASIVKVQDAQDEVLAGLGAPDLRTTLIDRAAAVSGRIQSLTVSGEEVNDRIGQITAEIEEFRRAAESLRNR
jgi:hypothetical protein